MSAGRAVVPTAGEGAGAGAAAGAGIRLAGMAAQAVLSALLLSLFDGVQAYIENGGQPRSFGPDRQRWALSSVSAMNALHASPENIG